VLDLARRREHVHHRVDEAAPRVALARLAHAALADRVVALDEPVRGQRHVALLADLDVRVHDARRARPGLDDAAIGDVRRLVLNEETLTNLSVTVGNLRTFSEQAMGTIGNVNALVATNGAQIDIAVSNVVFFSQDLIRLSDDAHGLISTNSAEISIAVKNIESSTETLKKLTDDLQSGNGLAGTLLKNEQLSTNVQAVAANLAVATSNLNRLGLWHFLWHHELPPTNTPPHETTKQP